MDRFVDARVLAAANGALSTGAITSGAADFSAATDTFSGALDPTFAGIPVDAASPYECNKIASGMAKQYGVFMSVKKSGGDAQVARMYTPQQVAFYSMLADQTGVCLSNGECGPSLNSRGEAAVKALTWTFHANTQDAPFGRSCQIHLRAGAKIVANPDAVSSVGDESDLGLRTLASVPYIRSDCAPSRVKAVKADQCTALALPLPADPNDDPARSWLAKLTPSGPGDTQESLIRYICDTYTYLDECACLRRDDSAAFQAIKTNFAITNPVCWYIPCNVPGVDRLLTPVDEDARNKCTANVCQNIVNVVGSTNISLEDMKAAINCSDTKAWDDAAAAANKKDGGGGDIIAGLGDAVTKAVTDWGGIAAVIVAAVVALAMLAYAAKLLLGQAPASAPPATN